MAHLWTLVSRKDLCFLSYCLFISIFALQASNAIVSKPIMCHAACRSRSASENSIAMMTSTDTIAKLNEISRRVVAERRSPKPAVQITSK